MWFSILGAPASPGDFWGNAVSVVLGQDPDISNFKLFRWFSGTKLNHQCSCCSVAKLHPTLCDPMDCSTPGSSVLHYLPMVPQTHVHQVDDAIQPSYPQSSPSPPTFNLSQHQGLFQWVGSLYHVPTIRASGSGSTFSMQFQDWFPLGLIGLISLLSKGLSRVFSSTTIWKHQFFSFQPSLWSNSHIHTWLLEKIIALTR